MTTPLSAPPPRRSRRRTRPAGPALPRFWPLILGLALGILLGLYLGWTVWPTQITESNPSLLDTTYRQDYTLMIAAAYATEGDLALARRRLAGLNEPDVDAWLLSVTNNHILDGRSPVEIGHLVALATDLGLNSPLMTPYLEAE